MKATTATSLEPSNLFAAFSEDTLPGVSLSTLMTLIFIDVRKEMLKMVVIPSLSRSRLNGKPMSENWLAVIRHDYFVKLNLTQERVQEQPR